MSLRVCQWAHHERLWLAEKGRGPLTPNGINLMLRRRGRAAGVNEAIGVFDLLEGARRAGLLLTPAESASALLTHLRQDGTGQIWDVDKTL